MDISVIICTYNRVHNLKDCFDCLASQKITADFTWEVVLVDNNSNDNTQQFVQDYAAGASFPLRYTFEPSQGISYARNHGVNNTDGDILVSIDDDIRVGANDWLQTIYDTFNTYSCDALCGRIQVESPAALPKWITPDMYGFLGHQDFGDKVRAIDGYTEYPFAGNMAIRRSAFDKIGLFDTELGRRGAGLKKNELFKGEEPDFFHRLAEAGGKIYYHPDILVLHKILPHQLKPSFFLTLHNNEGISDARRDNSKHARTLIGIPLFVFPQFLRAIVRYVFALSTEGYYLSFRRLMNVAYFAGMIDGYYKKQNAKEIKNHE